MLHHLLYTIPISENLKCGKKCMLEFIKYGKLNNLEKLHDKLTIMTKYTDDYSQTLWLSKTYRQRSKRNSRTQEYLL